MAVQRGGHLVPLESILHSHQKIGQRFRRNRQIFDHGNRSQIPLDPVQRGHHATWELPKQLDVTRFECLPGVERQLCFAANAIDRFRKLLAHECGIVAGMLHQEHRFGLGRNQHFVLRTGFARQTKVPAVEQIASTWRKRKNLMNGQGCAFQSIEKQQSHAAQGAGAASPPSLR